MNWEDFKAKYGDRPKDIIFALAFLEGKEMGKRVVVEFINLYFLEGDDKDFCNWNTDKWQAFLKEKEINAKTK